MYVCYANCENINPKSQKHSLYSDIQKYVGAWLLLAPLTLRPCVKLRNIARVQDIEFKVPTMKTYFSKRFYEDILILVVFKILENISQETLKTINKTFLKSQYSNSRCGKAVYKN